MSSVPAGLSGCMKIEHVQFLGLGPKRIELVAVVVAVIDVGGDVGAAKIQLGDRVLQHLRGALRFLNRHGGHRRKAIGMLVAKIL